MIPESNSEKKRLDKLEKKAYKDKSTDSLPIDEVVTVKKKEIIHALTTLEGLKRGLRKVLDRHRT